MAMTTPRNATGGAGPSASTTGSAYDLRRNPPYQIDVTAASSGKRLAQTKRRVRWRFGFSNASALGEGRTGTDCRGEEHDVTLVWSLTSGKRLVLADGKEVHFSMGKATSGKFQTSWTMRGNHTIKIIAYAAPPLKARPGFKQYELFLDGMPFLSFPKIYELGVKRGGGGSPQRRDQGAQRDVVPYSPTSRSAATSQRQPYNNYALPREEEQAWARNVERYEEERNFAPNVPVSDMAPMPPPTIDTAPSATDLVSDPVSAPGQDLLSQPTALLDYSAPPANSIVAAPVHDQFAPQAPPPPTYNDVAGNILSQYGGQPQPPQQQQPQQPPQQAVLALPSSTNYEQPPMPPQQVPQQVPQQTQAPQQYYEQPPTQAPQYYEQPAAAVVSPPQQGQQYAAPPPQQQFAAPPQQSQQQYYEQQPPPPQQYYEQQAQYGAPAVTPEQYATPVKTTDSDLENEAPSQAIVPVAPGDDSSSPKAVSEIDDVTRALKSLVNFDDITEKPEGEVVLTMNANPFDDKNKLREDQRKVKRGDGVPKSQGLAPTTNNWAMSNKCLAEVKDSVPKRQVTKEVMKPHAFDPAAAGAGMLVVHGAPAPPLQQAPQQYYAQQAPPQQQQYYQQGQPQQQQQQYCAQQQQAPPQHDYSQGPPPLGQHAAGGFGVGAQIPGGGYNSNQQQQYAAR